MIASAVHQAICRRFATLLSYPTNGVQQVSAACASLLRGVRPEAAASLDRFGDFLRTHAATQVEEVYTSTFDLQPVCCPYVGYQLCGESQRRALFLVKLRQLYRQYGFPSGVELPDHLSTVLRFVGTVSDPLCRQEIVEDGLRPALANMLHGLDAARQPYADLLKALQSFLTETADTTSARLRVVRRKECRS
ncbi:MAG: nitrate reductase molybdenum cofactor assembly chaperone [Candidatus Binatia bacterium]